MSTEEFTADLGEVGALDRLKKDLSELKRELAASAGLQERVLETGSRSVDATTGCGGLPRGALVRLQDRSAKRADALMYSTIAKTQANGGLAVIIDFNRRFSPARARRMGIDLKKLRVIREQDLEEALAAVRELAEADLPDLVVVDLMHPKPSSASWLAKYLAAQEEQAEHSASDQAAEASLASLREALHDLGESISSSNTCVLIPTGGYGARRTSYDVMASDVLGKESTIHINLKSAGRSPQKAKGVGGRTRIEVEHEPGTARREAFMGLSSRGGIAESADLFETGSALDLVERRGAVFFYSGERLGHGREKAIKGLESQRDLRRGLANEIESRLDALRKEAVGVPAAAEPPQVDEQQTEDTPSPSVGRGLLGRLMDDTKKSRDAAKGPLGDLLRGGKHAGRFVNTWFDGGEKSDGLVVGVSYTFSLQIAAQPIQEGGDSQQFAEPDFGHHSGVHLLISLYSDELEIEKMNHHLWLPAYVNESTEVASTVVRPTRAGPAEIRIVISLDRELEVLQRLRVDLEVRQAAQLPGVASASPRGKKT